MKTKSNQQKRAFEPIRNRRDIDRIRLNLRDNPRDLLLFDLAVQTGSGMKKLLQLKVKHLMGVTAGGKIALPKDTADNSYVIMTDVIHETFHYYLEKVGPKPDEYLFKSKKGRKPLNLSSVSNMIKSWFAAAGIKGSYGAISLRKTWEYLQRKEPAAQEDTADSSIRGLFTPIQTPSVQKVIYQELLSAIISGKIPPGSRLTTAEISKSFNVSHAPVRVALNWLEAKGFIVGQKKRGSIVKELSIEELREITKIRIILETAAIQFSYKVCTEETINLLESIIERNQKASTFEEADQLNKQFHETLYRDANMPLLVNIITDLYNRFSPYAALTYQRKGYIPDHHSEQKPPEYYQIQVLESLRRKNLPDLLKHLKTKLERGNLITEEILKEREGREKGTLVNSPPKKSC